MGFSAVIAGLIVACGGSEPEPGVPPPSGGGPEEAPDEGWDTGGRTPAAEPEPTPDTGSEGDPEARKEPEFTEGMSVNDAIAAVPSYYEYVGIEPDVLAKPLVDIETYKECKVGQNSHFTVKVAVWEGRVVGADVVAKGNPSLAQCIDSVVRKLEYKEKVKSINTVEFSF